MGIDDGELDQEEEPSLEVLSFVVFWLVVLLIGILSAGCSTTVAPNLKLPEKTCERLEMPPLPQSAWVQIRGDQVMADSGGEAILRYYVAARRMLKP